MNKDPIKFEVENHLNKELSKGSFSQEVLERVERRIQARVAYYDELFKDNPGAKKIASIFDKEERARLATYEKYQNKNHNKQELKFSTFFIQRERIIKNFHSDGLSKDQMKNLYQQDRINNRKKYLFSINRRKIIKDWAKCFSEMKIVNNRTMIQKRVGPIILEIYLGSTGSCPDCYHVCLSICNLLKIYQEHYILSSIMNITLDDIEVADHYDGLYLDLIEMAKERFWLPLEGEVSFEQIFNIPYKAENEDFYHAGKDAYLNALILISVWSGKLKMAQQYYEKTLNYLKKLDDSIDIDFWGGRFIEQTQDIKGPEKIRQIVQDNVKLFALEKIPYQDIVGINYKEKQK